MLSRHNGGTVLLYWARGESQAARKLMRFFIQSRLQMRSGYDRACRKPGRSLAVRVRLSSPAQISFGVCPGFWAAGLHNPGGDFQCSLYTPIRPRFSRTRSSLILANSSLAPACSPDKTIGEADARVEDGSSGLARSPAVARSRATTNTAGYGPMPSGSHFPGGMAAGHGLVKASSVSNLVGLAVCVGVFVRRAGHCLQVRWCPMCKQRAGAQKRTVFGRHLLPHIFPDPWRYYSWSELPTGQDEHKIVDQPIKRDADAVPGTARS